MTAERTWLAAAVAAACAAVAAAAWAPGPELKARPWVVGGLGALACGALAWVLGHLQFGGFDHSVLVDLAWRRAQGQHALADFPSTTPVGFVLGAGYAFLLFGPSWSSIVGLQALYAAGTFAWSFALLRRLKAGLPEALGVAFAVQAVCSLVTSYWWYNSTTTVAAALFFLSALALWRAPAGRLEAASYLASLVLVAAAKPNVTAPLIAGVTLVLLTSRAHWRRVLLLSAGALAAFAAWLALERLTVWGVVQGYLSVSGRGFTLAQFLQDLTPRDKTVGLGLAAACAVPFLLPRAPDVRTRALATVALLSGLFGFLTNGETKLVDLPLLFLAGWAVAGGGRLVAAVASLLVVAGLTAAVERDRVRAIGPGTFWEQEVTAEAQPTAFFARLRSGPRLVRIQKQLAALLAERRPARPFFGPRMQWAYAAYGLPSPAGEPVWWHPGVAFGPETQEAWVARWAEDRHDLLVFLANDFTYLPGSMFQAIQGEYRLLGGYPDLTVLVPR